MITLAQGLRGSLKISRVVVSVEAAVQKARMRRVDAAFEGLKVIGLLQTLDDELMIRRHLRDRQARQVGHALFRTHIRPNNAARFAQRISSQLYFLFEAGLWRFRRQVNAFAIDIIFPAMVNAA